MNELELGLMLLTAWQRVVDLKTPSFHDILADMVHYDKDELHIRNDVRCICGTGFIVERNGHFKFAGSRSFNFSVGLGG